MYVNIWIFRLENFILHEWKIKKNTLFSISCILYTSFLKYYTVLFYIVKIIYYTIAITKFSIDDNVQVLHEWRKLSKKLERIQLQNRNIYFCNKNEREKRHMFAIW